MKNNILFLKPYLVKKTWGGHNLQNYGISSSDNLGEAWIISGIEGKSSIILNEEHNNTTLFDFYQDHRAFFNYHESKHYPLLVKLLDCQEDLSIQVHPTIDYANSHKNVLPKSEAWYILDAKTNAQIVYGHKAQTKDELISLVHDKKWEKLLNFVSVRKQDLFYVPSGTVHALKKGLVILEIQQSSDTTFRLYDYERNQKDRPLNIHESMENINVPFVQPKLEHENDELLTTPFFSIKEIKNDGTNSYDLSYGCWLQCVVIEGNGYIEDKPIKKGSTFIIGNNDLTFKLNGKLTLIVSYIRR
ncbi:MAG: mannose-6-phosphate isomerase [Mycoplasmataceae bacterium]|nr:mannose-6-phosphate isomerase [Mycoplasmataceae bacterium]